MNSPHQFNIRNEIEQHAIFGRFPPWARETLISTAFTKHYRRGQKVMAAYEHPSALMIMLRGIVFIELLYPDGRKLTSYIPDYNGEMLALIQIFTGDPLPVDFVARTQASMIHIPKQVILNILAQSPQLMAPFITLLCERLHSISVQHSYALIQRPRERLIHLLLNLAKRYGAITPEGTLIGLRISQDDMSFMLSLSRQSINKELKSLKGKGLIKQAYGTIIILQMEALKALVQNIPPQFMPGRLNQLSPLLEAVGINSLLHDEQHSP